jgi:hypothetical protein
MGKHRKYGTQIYIIWKGIKGRCLNPNSRCYKHYGGRGITICEEWADSFEQFYKDVSNLSNFNESNLGYKGLTLDRTDNNKGYSKDNVRWVSMIMQNRNRSLSIANKTGYTGIYFNKRNPHKPFKVTIINNKKSIYLGCYRTKIEAVIRRNLYIIENNLKGFKLQTINNH